MRMGETKSGRAPGIGPHARLKSASGCSIRCRSRPARVTFLYPREGGDPSPAVQKWSRLEMGRSEEHTSELQSLMRISYAVFCLKKKNKTKTFIYTIRTNAKHMI